MPLTASPGADGPGHARVTTGTWRVTLARVQGLRGACAHLFQPPQRRARLRGVKTPLPLLRLLFLIAPLATACGTTQFSVTRRAPAEVNIPSGKVIAVTPLPGAGGEALSSELTQALLETKRFQVLERQHLDAAIAELKFSSQHVSDETAMSFGNMTGASTLVTGEVTKADYREDVSSSKDQCTTDDGTLRECVRYTRTAVADLRVVLKVIETESGKLLAAKTLGAQQQRSAAGVDQEPPALNVQDDLLTACRTEVVTAFVRVVAPHDKQVMVALRTDDDLPELETGNNYAKIGNWSAAVDQYRSAVAKSKALDPAQQAKALYNLGIGLGYSGAFDDGIAEVEHAYALDPDDLYREQAGVIRQFKEEAARLAAQEGTNDAGG